MRSDEPDFDVRPTAAAACIGALMLAVAFVFGGFGCGADDVAATSCDDHADCEYGTVCSESGECVEADCEFCDEDDEAIVCDPYAEVCTVRCSTDDDCEDGVRCEGGICGGAPDDEDGCDSDDDCPEGEICNPFTDSCEAANGQSNIDDPDCTGDDDCADDEVCEDGECIDDSDPNDLPNGSDCTLEEGDCQGAEPHLDEELCECVECLGDGDCGIDEQCVGGECTGANGGGGGDCPGGHPSCDPASPGDCGGDSPYCIEECCVECIGAGDCDGNDICDEDGLCVGSTGCSTDADCPTDHTCENGNCVAPGAGGSCQDDSDCPDGQFCEPDPLTGEGECQDLGGELGCGLCNPDCTCDGDTTCDGFMCVGCDIDPFGLDPNAAECPGDQICIPAGDFLGADENFCL